MGDQAPSSTPKSPLVDLRNVCLRYGRDPEILKDVNLTLPSGSFHFLTGASGAGKSSLLKLIYLAQKASSGDVRLFGHDVKAMSRQDLPFVRRRIGVIYQDLRLLDHLSVFDNVALPLRLNNERPDSYREDVAELLAWVGLGHRLFAKPQSLSGGEKQRLAIARAVVKRPNLILADEPTGNVDQAMGMRLLKLFVDLNRYGTTVVIATHDQDLVEASGMPVLHLEGGYLKAYDGDLVPHAPEPGLGPSSAPYNEGQPPAPQPSPGPLYDPVPAPIPSAAHSPLMEDWESEDALDFAPGESLSPAHAPSPAPSPARSQDHGPTLPPWDGEDLFSAPRGPKS